MFILQTILIEVIVKNCYKSLLQKADIDVGIMNSFHLKKNAFSPFHISFLGRSLARVIVEQKDFKGLNFKPQLFLLKNKNYEKES